MVLSPDRVRSQLIAQRGGAEVAFGENGQRIGGSRLLAVVTVKAGEQGRQYRLPRDPDYQALWKAVRKLNDISKEVISDTLLPIPNEPLPPNNTNCLRIPNYGMKQWGDVFTTRQKLALVTLARKLRTLTTQSVSEVDSVKDVLALTVSRCSDFNSSLNSWASGGEFVRGTFARQALSMVWDFCETMPLTTESGGYSGALDWVVRVVEALSVLRNSKGQVQDADACSSPLPDDAVTVWFTDPPYYNAVGYAELSDFFFVWLKRALPDNPLLRDPFDPNNPLVHKMRECVQDENYQSVDGRPKDSEFFEETIAQAFAEGRRVVKSDAIGCVVFAHKTTEGWEALLSGMIKGGWVVTGSWPVVTERPGRLRSQESAALASSIHLICRPRGQDAPVGDWSGVLRELPKRVGDWMERLQGEGIRGADLVFACIGPALEIYSQYSKVVDADEREIPLGGDPEAKEPHKRGYLSYVWEVVGRTALEHVLGTAETRARNSMAGALEEDARLTALFLWTLQSTNPSTGLGAGGEQATGTRQEATEEESEEDEEEDEEDKTKEIGR